MSSEARLYRLYDSGMNSLNRVITLDCDHTHRLTRGDGAILRVDAAEKLFIFGFKAAFVLALPLEGAVVAPACARE
jgi:hypothetical protein